MRTPRRTIFGMLLAAVTLCGCLSAPASTVGTGNRSAGVSTQPGEGTVVSAPANAQPDGVCPGRPREIGIGVTLGFVGLQWTPTAGLQVAGVAVGPFFLSYAESPSATVYNVRFVINGVPHDFCVRTDRTLYVASSCATTTAIDVDAAVVRFAAGQDPCWIVVSRDGGVDAMYGPLQLEGYQSVSCRGLWVSLASVRQDVPNVRAAVAELLRSHPGAGYMWNAKCPNRKAQDFYSVGVKFDDLAAACAYWSTVRSEAAGPFVVDLASGANRSASGCR